MKVLLLVSELEDYTIAFANGLVRHIAVVLVVPKRNYAGLVAWLDPAIELHLMDWPRHRSLRNPAFLLRLLRVVRRAKPDIIHLLSNNALWLNFVMPFWRRMALITTVHDVTVHPGDAETLRLPQWATDLIVRQSDDIVVHGTALQAAAALRFARLQTQIHVLPHPAITRYCDLAQRKGLQPTPSDGQFRVLMFGRIFAYKGLAHLIEAEALLLNRLPHLQVTIAGRGDSPLGFGYLMGDRQRYDLRHRFIPDAEVAQLFLDTDLVVLPYTEASQSGVLNVAAAFGKPVVATDVGELGASVKAHGLGMVVPPANPEALAQAIVQIAETPELRHRYARQAKAWAHQVTAPDRVGAQAQALYAQVLWARNGGSSDAA